MSKSKRDAHPTCAHRPKHLSAWTAKDGTLCVACNNCGKVLKGAA